VFVGSGFHDLIKKFTLSQHEDGGIETCEGSKLYKLIVFMAEPEVLMPAVEILSNTPVVAMPNKAWRSKLKHPSEMFVALEGIYTPMNDLALIQKTLFPNKLFRVESQWLQSPENPKAMRPSPTVVNGEPWSFDDNLAFLRKQAQSEIDFAVFGDDLESGLDILWYCLARYGNNKRFKFNKARDRVFTDVEWTYTNNMGMESHNRNWTGAGLIDSIMFWPKKRIEDPDEYAEAQVKIFEVCKKHDVSMPVRSMPMKPNRSMLFFAYRYGLDKVGSPSWDELVVQVCSDQEMIAQSFVLITGCTVHYHQIFALGYRLFQFQPRFTDTGRHFAVVHHYPLPDISKRNIERLTVIGFPDDINVVVDQFTVPDFKPFNVVLCFQKWFTQVEHGMIKRHISNRMVCPVISARCIHYLVNNSSFTGSTYYGPDSGQGVNQIPSIGQVFEMNILFVVLYNRVCLFTFWT